MEFGSSILADIWVVETTKDRTAFDTKLTVLREKFARLEAALSEGSYFAGTRFSVVDAVFAPVFRYFEVFDTITDLAVFDGLPKLQSWRKALALRPSVTGAVVRRLRRPPARFPAQACGRAGPDGNGGVRLRSRWTFPTFRRPCDRLGFSS